ncbi:MAG: ParB/RepB/Spo0J family partition protein [Mollicutes bacterium]|nr:ParB/RepB/Spo0J family partition protein [Mollicutes bacterium]
MNSNSQVVDVFVEEIIPNRFQPRLSFDEKKINELAASIKVHGIIQPLVLRKIGDKYEIIAGERRYKAATMVGLNQVPAIVVEMDDNKSAEIALVENLQRKDLSAIETAKSFKKILDMGQLNQEQLAEKMGISQSSVANKLRLLNLDEKVQQALLEEKISERHARSLLSVENFSEQQNLLRKILEERLTVRKLDEEIKNMVKKDGVEKMEIFEESEKLESFDLSEPNVLEAKEETFEIADNVQSFVDTPPIQEIETPVVEIFSQEQSEPIKEENISVQPEPVSEASNMFFGNAEVEQQPVMETNESVITDIPSFEELSILPEGETSSVVEPIEENKPINLEQAIND